MLKTLGVMGMNIGERLAWYRVKANHTQESLSVASGVGRQRISEIEGNKRGRPSVKTLEKLLNQCGVSLDEFFRIPEGQRETVDNGRVRLHTMLDDLLDSGEPYSGAMKLNIESAHAKLAADRAEASKQPAIKKAAA